MEMTCPAVRTPKRRILGAKRRERPAVAADDKETGRKWNETIPEVCDTTGPCIPRDQFQEFG